MQVSNVSFGQVVTVSGTPKKIKNIDKNYYFNIKMVKDITRRD